MLFVGDAENGDASDDRRNRFERGGWARGKRDEGTTTFIKQTYQRADAFLLDRRTYEIFAGSWGLRSVGGVREPRRESRPENSRGRVVHRACFRVVARV